MHTDKILYVEDDPDIQTLVKRIFKRQPDYEMKVCSSGIEALNCISDFRPDVLLLDVMMPGLDGIKTLEKMRKIPGFGTTPAIFLTAKAQRTEIEEYLSCGGVGVIHKPFDPMTLAEQITKLISDHASTSP